MAVTLTAAALAVRLRIIVTETEYTDLAQGLQDTVTGLLTTGTLIVERYAPIAPEAAQNEALIRLAGWLHDTDPAEIRRVQSPLMHSGAAAVIAPWRRQTSATSTADATSTAAAAGAVPGAGVDLDTVRAIVADWAEFDSTGAIPAAKLTNAVDETARAEGRNALHAANVAGAATRSNLTHLNANITRATSALRRAFHNVRVTLNSSDPNRTTYLPAFTDGPGPNINDLHIRVDGSVLTIYQYTGSTWAANATLTATGAGGADAVARASAARNNRVTAGTGNPNTTDVPGSLTGDLFLQVDSDGALRAYRKSSVSAWNVDASLAPAPSIVALSQTAYDALTADSSTLYVITS